MQGEFLIRLFLFFPPWNGLQNGRDPARECVSSPCKRAQRCFITCFWAASVLPNTRAPKKHRKQFVRSIGLNYFYFLFKSSLLIFLFVACWKWSCRVRWNIIVDVWRVQQWNIDGFILEAIFLFWHGRRVFSAKYLVVSRLTALTNQAQKAKGSQGNTNPFGRGESNYAGF